MSAPTLFVHIPKTGGTSISRAFPVQKQIGEAEKPGAVIKNWNHCHAGQERDRWPEDLWVRAFKFSIVRNPFERLYSMYLGNWIASCDGPFEEWFKRHMKGDRLSRYHPSGNEPDTPVLQKPQLRWLTDYETGEWLVDFVGRFERLGQDFETIRQRLGVDADLPHVNASGDSSAYREAYPQWMREWVEHYFAPDLEAFGYQF